MMNFKYHVTCFANSDEIEIRTNNIITALDAFFTSVEDGSHAHIVDGTTGEVLAITNAPGDDPNYATEEMALMMLGHLMATEWGEAEAEEAECVDCEPDEPQIKCMVCGDGAPAVDPMMSLLSALFGVPADEVIALPPAEGLPS